jgi:hypothetical protein
LYTLFSNMADRRASANRKSTEALLKRMFIMTLVLMTLSALFLLLLTLNHGIAIPLLEWVGVAALGVGAGLAARWQLREYTLTLKFLTAVLALAINLWLLGWLSSGLVGFTVRSGISTEANWRGIIQLSLGSVLAWMSLWAGKTTLRAKKSQQHKTRKSSRSGDKAGKSAPRSNKSLSKKTSRNSSVRQLWKGRKPVMPSVHFLKGNRWPQLQSRFKGVVPTASLVWKNSIRRLQKGVVDVKISADQARLSLGKKFARHANNSAVRLGNQPLKIRSTNGIRGDSSEIHLLGEVEHRCPFCLEIVEKNDPRGVKICPICHTRHHADCWAVTGTCQVPHSYE